MHQGSPAPSRHLRHLYDPDGRHGIQHACRDYRIQRTGLHHRRVRALFARRRHRGHQPFAITVCVGFAFAEPHSIAVARGGAWHSDPDLLELSDSTQPFAQLHGDGGFRSRDREPVVHQVQLAEPHARNLVRDRGRQHQRSQPCCAERHSRRGHVCLHDQWRQVFLHADRHERYALNHQMKEGASDVRGPLSCSN